MVQEPAVLQSASAARIRNNGHCLQVALSQAEGSILYSTRTGKLELCTLPHLAPAVTEINDDTMPAGT